MIDQPAPQFTLGPWEIGGSAVVDRAVDYSIIVSVHGDAHIIAETYGRSDWEHEHQSYANARLIAAAPDMYAVLREVAKLYPNDPGTSDLDDDQPVSVRLGTLRKVWRVLAQVK